MIPANKRLAARFMLGAVIVAASAGAGHWIQSTRLGGWVEQRSYDFRFVLRGPLPRSSGIPITILGIDDESLDKFPEPLMFWHRNFADAIDALVEVQAAVIGIDFLFSDITAFDGEGQRRLAESLLKAAAAEIPIVLGYRVKSNGMEEPAEQIKFAAIAAGHELAYLNLTTDNDDFVRRQLLGTGGPENELRPGFALALAAAFAKKAHKPFVPLQARNRTILINYAGPNHFDTMSFEKAVAAGRDRSYSTLSRLRGRIVLLGALMGTEDLHSTPYYYAVDRRYSGQFARTRGIDIHANTLATILTGNAIEPLRPRVQLLITLALATLVTMVCFRFRPLVAFLFSFVFITGYVILAVDQTFQQRLWVFVVSPVSGALAAAVISQASNYILEGREKQQLRKLFRSYVNDQVIEQILQAPEALALAGKTKRVTVLFADIRGFTTWSEDMKPQDLVAGLNRYFKAMIDAIQKRNGMIDKFIGDGIMALFGAPLDDPDAALHAVEAGRDMLTALHALNEQFAAEGAPPIRIGIGVHSGEVVVGNIGSAERMEYTAIGDVVNTASRVEGLTRLLDADILITADTFEELNGRVTADCLGPQAVKGRMQPVIVHRVR